MATTKSSTRKKPSASNRRPDPIKVMAFQLGSWLVLLLVIVGVLFGLSSFIRTSFFTDNPWFTLRDIDYTIKGEGVSQKVYASMVDLRIDEVNLFDIDVNEVRKRLSANPLVKSAEVSRVMPDTLKIVISSRQPIAKLRQGRRTTILDKEGLVMAIYDPNDEDSLDAPALPTGEIPTIFGLTTVQDFMTNDVIEDKLLQGTLNFLRKKSKMPNGHWIQVSMITLQPDHDQFTVICKGAPQHGLAEGAEITFPLKGLDDAMAKVSYILENNVHRGTLIDELNAAIRKGPPLVPAPVPER